MIKVIAVSGLSRCGKDTFCNIAKNILTAKGYRVKQYSFADQLKTEVAPFLSNLCGVDVWTQDSDVKKDIRDFLVWYGTTFWRKRDPKRWIREVDVQLKQYSNELDFALISDVRYPNEGEWVHSMNGYLVHIAGYTHDRLDCIQRLYFDAPNKQEEINDPLVYNMSDYKFDWEMKYLTPDEAINDTQLRSEVLRALNSCDCFTESIS